MEAHYAEVRPDRLAAEEVHQVLPNQYEVRVHWLDAAKLALLGEEQVSNMLVLLTILVSAAHALGVVALLAEAPAIRPAQPLPMQVAMITLPPAPQIQPIQPQPQPVPPEPKPVVKKQPVKPVVKPVAKTAQPVVKQPVPEPEPNEAPAAAPVAAPAAAPAPVVEKAPAPVITEPNYRANYASNPRPVYPSVARSHGWQGRVALRVQVTEEGLAASVRIEQSSGHEVLDEAAVEAVKQWRFVPGKHGDTPVASSVVVPLNFALQVE